MLDRDFMMREKERERGIYFYIPYTRLMLLTSTPREIEGLENIPNFHDCRHNHVHAWSKFVFQAGKKAIWQVLNAPPAPIYHGI